MDGSRQRWQKERRKESRTQAQKANTGWMKELARNEPRSLPQEDPGGRGATAETR